MKTKFKVALLLFLFLGMIPSSCCSLGCGGCDGGGKFLVESIEMRTMNDRFDDIDPTQSHTYEEAYKVIHLVSLKEVSEAKVIQAPLFINSSFACSPAPPRIVNPIMELSITAANSFSLESETDVIQVGSDITDRFEAGYYPGYFMPIDDIYGEQYLGWDRFILLRLKNQPFASVDMELDVSMRLADGSTYFFEGEQLILD